MKANNVKIWARIGQIAFWIYNISFALFEIQLPDYVLPEYSATVTAIICVIVTLIGMLIFSEAIVQLICYFAEILESRN